MKVRSRRPWLMWLFVALALLFNFAMPPLLDWLDFSSFEKAIQAALFFAGVVAGECCFVVLLSGFAKRTWFGAYLFGLGLAVAGYGAMLCGSRLVNEFNAESVSYLALLPALLLAATCPLSIFRHFFGWRLVNLGETPVPRQPLRLSGIFSIIAIVAAILVLVRVPLVIAESEPGNFWPQVVIMCLISFGTSLVILPIHARVALGDAPVHIKLVWLVVLAIAIVVIGFGIVQCFNSRGTSWQVRLEVLPFLLTFFGAALGTFYISLLLLAASGMRLVRGRHAKQASENEYTQTQAAHLQRLTWWRIGGAIAVTMATSVYLANLQQWRAVKDKENRVLVPRAIAAGGTLWISDRIPTNLSLGAKATNDDLAAFSNCRQLKYLNLEESQITDAGLEHLVHFPQLRSLSLKHVPITDAGLAHLIHLAHLETLEIEGSPIKASNLLCLPRKRQLTSLTLSHTQFGDNECQMLIEFPVLQALVLNHTPITDCGLSTLGRIKSLTALQLVGTEVGIDKFPFLPALQNLDLSNTQVNDAAVSSIARIDTLQSLSLRETKVTNASLSDLSKLPALYRLDLSDTAIDDEGIRQLSKNASLVSLDLSCTQVTGSGFRDWPATTVAFALILDRTLLDDQGVAALVSMGQFDELSLAHTGVTDASLPHLAQIAINKLDIRDTKITFNGLISNALPNVSTLYVTPGQFTAPQISQIKSQLGIKVTTRTP